MFTIGKPAFLAVFAVLITFLGLTSCSTEPGSGAYRSSGSATERLQDDQATIESKTESNKKTESDKKTESSAKPDSDLKIDSKADSDAFVEARAAMVARQLAGRDIKHEGVLKTMGRVPRHQFVPTEQRPMAYQDSPLPIGERQTISQPYIVALMTQLAEPDPTDKALDIGTGSGYQAAVLAEMVKSVHSIEIVESLAINARDRLNEMGYENIVVSHGDGYRGWESEAPFDIIIVAAAPGHIPEPLIDQLAKGGKMVIPVGKSYQELMLIGKGQDGTVKKTSVAPVRFVPMTGEAQK